MYIFEKGIMIPVCAVVGGVYVDYWTGEIIDNKKTTIFIDTMLKKKQFIIKRDIDLKIYKIPASIFAGVEGYDFCLMVVIIM